MWKMKAIVTTLLLSTFLTACNIQTVQQYEDERDEKSAKVVEAEPKSEKKESEKATASKEKPDEKKPTVKNEINKTTTTEKPVATQPESVEKETVAQKEPVKEAIPSKNETQKPNNIQKPVKQEKPVEKPVKPSKPVQTKPNKEPAKPNHSNNTKPPVSKPKPIPPKPVEKPAKKEYAMVSIGMKVLLKPENYEKLPKALQNPKYVPENGVIVSSAKVGIEKGDTAWDAISQLRAKYGIHMDYVNNPLYGIYIKGINHVYEFDAGEMSGWMYTVNGVKAPVGVGTYKLKDGDSISLQYTTNGGTDLGW